MIDRVVNTKSVKNADVVVLSVPYEEGVSFMGGTSKAPKKIVDCLNSNLELFDSTVLCEPAKVLKTAQQKVSGLKKTPIEKVIKKTSIAYKKLLDDGKFIITLGGEHTVSLGALQTIAEKENPKDITILQIDAHQDLRNDNSDYSYHPNKYSHASVMRRAHELGFNLVQVGIRTFSKYEYDYWQKNKNTIKVFEWGKHKKEPKVDEVIKAIKTKKVYLTIDVDGFDPCYMPGTGTPVQDGLEWWYGLELIERVNAKKNVIGADIVEVSPQRDSVLTEYGASQLCYTIMTEKFKKRLKS